jgi:hypothetical protein
MKQVASRADSEDVGDMFLRNFGRLSTDYMPVISQTIELFITTAVITSVPTKINYIARRRHVLILN